MTTAEEESFASARAAVPTDLAQLEELEAHAVELAAPQRGGELYLLHDARTTTLADLVGEPLAAVVVGTIDGVPLGYAVAEVAMLTNNDRLGVISDLFVEPDARQVGVGEAMMNTLLEWATAQGCRGVDATALPGDRHTKNFFESFGLVARAISVHRALPT